MEPLQLLAVRLGASLTTVGLHRLLPSATRDEVDAGWWSGWVSEVAEPIVGPVGSLAFRVPGNPRVSVLVMDEAGKPLAFAKLVDEEQATAAAAASRLLGGEPPGSFHVPDTLSEGTHEGRRYRLLQALPEGPHLPPPFEPERLWTVVDEFRSRLSALPRPPDCPSHHVPCHADLTPRNLRLASDGTWWMFDFDLVRWGPVLADELRYWCAALAYRRRPDVSRDAAAVVELLRRRGSDEEILEAATWPDRVLQTYRPIEPEMHAEIARLVSG